MKNLWHRDGFEIVSLFLSFLLILTESKDASENTFIKRSSLNPTYVHHGEPLQFNVTVNTTACASPDFPPYYIVFTWYFRGLASFERLLRQSVYYSYNSNRLTLGRKASLLLLNPTLSNSGTYKLESSMESKCFKQQEFSLNVTFIDYDGIPTSSRSSINSRYVIKGEQLELDLGVNITGYYTPCQYFDNLHIYWYFRPFASSSYKQVMFRNINDNIGNYDYKYSNDARFSIVNKTSLLLVNTTSSDSGTYRLKLRCWRYFKGQLYFNTTIVDSKERYKPKFITRSSPSPTYVSQGEQLELISMLNFTACGPINYVRYVTCNWYFRRFLSVTTEHVLRHSIEYYHDLSKSSLINTTSFLMLNSTFNDSGTYELDVSARGKCFQDLFFNVTILDHRNTQNLKCSMDSTYVIQGETLQLNITGIPLQCHPFGYRSYFTWYFRPFVSNSYKNVLHRRGHFFHHHDYSSDPRFSFGNKVNLLLVNTTLNDGGTYWFKMECQEFYHRQKSYFNATIIEKPKAVATCPPRNDLGKATSFSCWCKASGNYDDRKVVWYKNGRKLGSPVKFEKELFLGNVSKKDIGKYVCQAQVHNIMDEKKIEIFVNYPPHIVTFQYVLSLNSTKLSCLADGIPEPSYVIQDSTGKKIPKIRNGEVIENFFETNNTFYICIASNKFGQNQRRLDVGHSPCFEGQSKISSKNSSENQWYYFLITLFVGLVCGVGLLFLIQKIIRRKAIAKQRTETEERPNLYETPERVFPNSYIKPAVLPTTSSEYQELGVTRDPDNVYMDLRMTSRMKTAAQ